MIVEKEVFDNGRIVLYHADCMEVLPYIIDRGDAVICDPPYGISWQTAHRRPDSVQFDVIHNDDDVVTDWIPMLNNLLAPSACLFMFTRWDVEHEWRAAAANSGWNVRSQVIWYKPGGSMGDLRTQFSPSHENAIFAIKGDWQFPDKRPLSVYVFNRDAQVKYEHPTQKPVSLLSRIVLDITTKDQLVLDPFFGSCPVGVACARFKRRYIGIEVNREYFELGCRNVERELAQLSLF